MHLFPPLDMPDDPHPSSLALKHEREISSLRSGHEAIEVQLGDIKVGMQKWERQFEVFTEEIRGQFSRLTQKNPSVYIGAITILFGVITMASALTIFTINAMNGPMRVQIEEHTKRAEAMETRERANHEMLVRLDEREKMRAVK